MYISSIKKLSGRKNNPKGCSSKIKEMVQQHPKNQGLLINTCVTAKSWCLDGTALTPYPPASVAFLAHSCAT
jgi:hypothetical protein